MSYISAVSFHVSHTITLFGKSLSDGDYIKKVVKSFSKVLFGDFPNKTGILKSLDELPVARNTVKDRMIAINGDVTDQLLIAAICLDGRADVTSPLCLTVFARFSAENMKKSLLN